MVNVRYYQVADSHAWDGYIDDHPAGVFYHLSGWKNVIQKTYGHPAFYLLAEKTNGEIAGILPLVHLKHMLFGNSLISIPFFDMAGLVADNESVRQLLIEKAVVLAKKVETPVIELRAIGPEAGLNSSDIHKASDALSQELFCENRSHKVRMLLSLPGSAERLWNSFKSKHRNKIKKPTNEGLYTKIGGKELLSDFYRVFSVNMRDLGSPVHSKGLIQNVLAEFPQQAKIVIVYKENQPLACGLFIGFKSVMENPWSSFLRSHARIRPNYLLYWAMLEYACDNGYEYFDFGRSSPEEGTYKFKEQWGAKPEPLFWQYLFVNGAPDATISTDNSKFDNAVRYWQKLPVPVATFLGPLIRKHIGL